MKALIKKYWPVILVALLLCLLGIQNCTIKKLKDDKQLQQVEINTLKDSVVGYIGKNGEVTYKLQQAEVEKDNLKKSLEIAGFDIKELKSRDIQWRKITEALRAELAATGSGTVTLRDTVFMPVKPNEKPVEALTFTWDNEYLLLNGKIVNKQMDFEYLYRTKFDVIITPKGKSNIVNIYMKDPKAQILSGHSVTVKPVIHWYEKWYVHLGAGVVAGYLIAK